MSFDNFEPRVESAPPKEQSELSLVSLNVGSDLASMAGRSMVGCDVLFNQRESANHLAKTLGRGDSPADPALGRELAQVLNGGLGSMQMRVDRLNDFLREQGAKAVYDQQTGRLTLATQKGKSATYETYEDRRSGELRVSPRPVAFRSGR